MKVRLRMKCSNCGQWNKVPVNKILVQQPSSELKVKILIPMYEPLQVSKCKRCGKVIAEPKELVISQAFLLSIQNSKAIDIYVAETAFAQAL